MGGKLSNLNLPPHLFAWLSDYFNLHFQTVILGGHSSSWSPVTSGVPQGSILGSLLFLVYVNDIFDLHLSSNANLMVYANNILLSKPIATSSDLTALQSDLNLISDWLSNNLLELTMNVNKTNSQSSQGSTLLIPTAVSILLVFTSMAHPWKS